LCGALSPSFLSIVNGLGPTICPCFCLVPCCMPKEVLRNKKMVYDNHSSSGDDHPLELQLPRSSKSFKPAVIPVGRYEDPITRGLRLDDEQRRVIAKKKLCRTITTADDGTGGQEYACWSCGRFGHQKIACLDPLPRQRRERPTYDLDVSYLLQQPSPCAAYCELLLSCVDVDHYVHRRLWETGIVSHEAAAKQLDSNWNRNRKSIYIVASSLSSSSSSDEIVVAPPSAVPPRT
jgi:hypothetical protein